MVRRRHAGGDRDQQVLRASTAGAISRSTGAMICGFTARMTTSASRDERGGCRRGRGCRTAASSWLERGRRARRSRRSSSGGHEAGLEQALDEGLAHVAGAEEADPLALDAHAPGSLATGARGPKMAVPTRTMVAPSSIATSKSRAHAHRQLREPVPLAPARAARRNHGRASSGSLASGGIAISPRTRTWASAADRVEQRARPRRAPRRPCCGSSPTLTSSSASTVRPGARAPAGPAPAPARAGRASGCSRRAASASLALLVCRWPIRCQGTGRPSPAILSLRLLHAVLAERRDAGRDGRPDALDVHRLRDADEQHVVGARARRARHARAR